MLHLIAYDIAHPKRLRRVAQICEDFGVRVEYSVFECDLSRERFERFWKLLLQEIDTKNDALLVYCICAECLKKSHVAGTASHAEKQEIYIF